MWGLQGAGVGTNQRGLPGGVYCVRVCVWLTVPLTSLCGESESENVPDSASAAAAAAGCAPVRV